MVLPPNPQDVNVLTGAGGDALERVLLFLLIVVGFFAAIAQRIRVPYPILLLLAGLALSFLPGLPKLTLSPGLVFNLVLPPLLYAAAWQTNYREFRRQIVPITMLATGLVIFTVFGVALFADHFITTLDFRSGFLLGAIIAATDAVAATSIGRTLGLPRRIMTIIEGESLLNDATALLALELGLAMLLDNREPRLGSSLLRLLWLVAAGVGAGLLVARLMAWVERWIDGGPLEIAVSLVVPYIAYLLAETLHGSGVLAVVACGLYLSRNSSRLLTAQARLEMAGTWAALDFLLNGTMFALIGLQLPTVLAGIRYYSVPTLISYGVLFSLLLITLRMVWVFPGARIARWIRRRVMREDLSKQSPPSRRNVFIVGWTGMRGVVSLAAALSLPTTLSNGQPFQQRNLILFLTFTVIFVTLVVQGLGLPPMIRALGMGGDDHEVEREWLYAMRVTAESAIQRLEERRAEANEDDARTIDELVKRYERQLESVRERHAEGSDGASSDRSSSRVITRNERRFALVRDAVSAEREALLQLRETNTVDDEVVRRIERTLDLTETRFSENERG